MTQQCALTDRVFATLLRTRDTDVTRVLMPSLLALVPIMPAPIVPTTPVAIALATAVHDSYVFGRLPAPRLAVLCEALRDQPWQGPRWIGAPWVFEMACVVAAMSAPVEIRPDSPAWSAWRDYHLASGDLVQIARWAEAEHSGMLQEWRPLPPVPTSATGALH